MKEAAIIIPGPVELAMLTSMIDAYGWLLMQIRRLEDKIWKVYGVEIETPVPYAVLPTTPSIKVETLNMMEPLKLDLGRTKFFKIRVNIPQQPELEERIIHETEVQIYRRVYGLLSSLTDRELEVLEKRIDKRKSVAETAEEMNITPQGVVSFLRSIRGKVHKYLFVGASGLSV